MSNLSSKSKFHSFPFHRIILSSLSSSMLEKCPYSELFWSAFSHIRTECGEILCISPIQSLCRKIRTRTILNTDTFYAVLLSKLNSELRATLLWNSLNSMRTSPWRLTKITFRLFDNLITLNSGWQGGSWKLLVSSLMGIGCHRCD